MQGRLLWEGKAAPRVGLGLWDEERDWDGPLGSLGSEEGLEQSTAEESGCSADDVFVLHNHGIVWAGRDLEDP